MGRYFVELDPTGFSYCAEPGAMFEWAAPTYIQNARAAYQAANPGLGLPVDYAYALPGHPWLSCTPRQTHSDWVQDDRLIYHVLRSGDEWVWSPSVADHIREWDPTKRPDGTGVPANKWQSVPAIPADAISLLSLDWSEIEHRSGINLPDGMTVVAAAGATPTGADLQNKTPFIQCQLQPAPNDVTVFGFGQFILILSEGGVTLLKQDSIGIRFVGVWDYEGGQNVGSFEYQGPGKAGLTSAPAFTLSARSVLVLNTPPGHLGLVFGSGKVVVVEVNPTEIGDVFPVNVTNSAWWVAGGVGSRLTFQVQVVGYENVNTGTLRLDTIASDFDLGVTYLPTIEPELNASTILHNAAGQAAPTAVLSTNSFVADSASTGENVTLRLYDVAGIADPWSSDGSHHAGFWLLEMVASTDYVGGYLTPYIRDWVLKFPVRLIDRLCNPLLLDDTQFSRFAFDVSYYEEDGKRIEIDLWDTGLATLQEAGFDTREGYPVIVWEDTDGDNVKDTYRAVGWVKTPDIEEHFTLTDSREAVRFYRLSAKGVLSRGDSDWLILPQMVDPSVDDPADFGHVEHTYAVREAVLAMGIDVDDPSQYEPAVDTQIGTERSRLPGAIGSRPYSLQLDDNNDYAPSYDEKKLEYAKRIAEEWAGWVIYETAAGLVRYHPDLMFELTLGENIHYYISFPVYWSTAAAETGGHPGQYFLASPAQTLRPVEANSIRVVPAKKKKNEKSTDDDEEVPLFDPVVVHDSLGWLDPTYENFIGEPRPQSLAFKMAKTQSQARILAEVALLTRKQLGVDWTIEVPLAPWDMFTDDDVDVGYIGTIQGKGDRLVTHMSVELLKSGATSVLKTKLTLTRLPSASGAIVDGIKPYPGRMIGPLDSA